MGMAKCPDRACLTGWTVCTYICMVCVCIRSTCTTCSLVLYYSSQDWRTALHCASEGGHHDTVRVLFERGADPNTYDWVSGV